MNINNLDNMINYNSYRIKGVNKLKGEIYCIGSKNLTSQAMIAAIIGSRRIMLTNSPLIGDVEITASLLCSVGVNISFETKQKFSEISLTKMDQSKLKTNNLMSYKENKNCTIIIDPCQINNSKVTLPKDIQMNRMPILIMGALLNKFNSVTVPLPRGCKIGERGLDIHFDIMQKLGIEITLTEEDIIANKPTKFSPINYELVFPSVGATQNFLFLTILIDGISILKNAAVEPEIKELIKFLNFMGANIELEEEEKQINVKGVENLNPIRDLSFHDINYFNDNENSFEIFGDRIDAASWACLAYTTDGEITLNNINLDSLQPFLKMFKSIGGGVDIKETLIHNSKIRFYKNKLTDKSIIKNSEPIYLKSEVWPGFSTDWIQPFSIILSMLNCDSIIHETIFENRLEYLIKLRQLGLSVEISDKCPNNDPCRFYNKSLPHVAIIKGPCKFISYKNVLEVLDLRSGFAYLIAAAISEGEIIISGVNKIERGYGNITETLKILGMQIEKINI